MQGDQTELTCNTAFSCCTTEHIRMLRVCQHFALFQLGGPNLIRICTLSYVPLLVVVAGSAGRAISSHQDV